MEQNSNNNIPNLTETDLFKFLDKFKFFIIIKIRFYMNRSSFIPCFFIGFDMFFKFSQI